MKYRKFGNTGLEVSQLGFGIMRLPLKEGGESASYIDKSCIDLDKTEKMIHLALDKGINYVDTAYTYAGGAAEEILGNILGERRKDIHIATKFPLWPCEKESDFERILDEQLTSLKTDHIDVYMLHGLNKQLWEDKVLPMGIVDKIFAAKRDGRVRHIGFSFHDDLGMFKRIADYAPWEFCQIQLNYLDIKYQAGIAGMKYASEKGMAVSIMEPLRGGYLTNMPDDVADVLGREKKPVEWAFDFLWDMPEVSVVLSGMNSEAQVNDNIEYASRAYAGMLTDEQRGRYEKARDQIAKYGTVPCTGCAYCMHCPRDVAIPYNFKVYNEYKTHGDMELAMRDYNKKVPLYGEKASECIGCGSCEEMCPQGLKITEWMPKIDEMFTDKR